MNVNGPIDAKVGTFLSYPKGVAYRTVYLADLGRGGRQ